MGRFGIEKRFLDAERTGRRSFRRISYLRGGKKKMKQRRIN